MLNKAITLITGLFILSMSYWLINFKKGQEEATQDLSQRPQFYMENFTQWVADADGTINTKLTGASLDLFTKKDYASIKNPTLTINLQQPKSQWKISSSYAQGFTDKILLSGAVQAKSAEDGKIFNTPALWLNYKTGLGSTKDKVTVKSGIMNSTGTGANFNSNTNEITILSDTFTTYEPTKPNE